MEMDGPWELLDLSYFSRPYVQVYSLLYACHVSTQPEDSDAQIHYAFNAFPWKGGWSVVGFYDSLRRAIPRIHQPRIVSINYASPGYIDLTMIVAVALSIKLTVDFVCDAIDRVDATYTSLHKSASERRILRKDVRTVRDVDDDNDRFAHDASATLLDHMGLLDLLYIIDEITRSPIATLKIVFSLYRRVRNLARLRRSNKINF